MVRIYRSPYLRICAWCAQYLGPVKGQYSGDTHGICKDDFKKQAASVKSLRGKVSGIVQADKGGEYNVTRQQRA